MEEIIIENNNNYKNNNLKQVDFIEMYNLYIKNYVKSIKLLEKYKLNDDQKKVLLKMFHDSPFLSENLGGMLEKKINKSTINDYIYKLELNQGPVYFHFVSDKNIKSINKIVKYYFFVVFLRLNYNNIYNKLQFTENVFINIVTMDVPKKILVPVSIDDINSASTIIYDQFYGGPIYIWREDELEKVLIHEALHSMHYDMGIIRQTLSNEIKLIDEKISGEQGVNLNEAYTELCASFLRSLFELGKTKIDKKEAKKKVRKIMEKELEHSIKNSGFLLGKYGLKSLGDSATGEYRQNASAFSYIIIKSGLLWTIMNKCKSREEKHTDRVKCLEEFLGLGFWGSIGNDFQKLVFNILTDDYFIKLVDKNIKIKPGRPENLFFTVF